jgi:hypothetical protein
MMISRIAIAGLVLGAGCLIGLSIAAKNRRAAQNDATSACRLSMPHSSIDPMVFPTKSGSEALDAAIMGNADDNAIRRVISEQGGFTVTHGTACSRVDTGPSFSQIVITEGPFVGKTVWAPTTHTHGGVEP